MDVRAGAHSDYGSLTLLFQRPGQPGLEILSPAEKTWAPVPVLSDDNEESFPLILVNVGDLLSYWTDGKLKSTVHKVSFQLEQKRSPTSTRYSIAYFCHPTNTTELVPVPSGVVAAYRKQHQSESSDVVGFGGGAGSLLPGKRALTAEEHLKSRLDATYNPKK